MGERISRKIKLERMEQNWYYRRSGVDEKPAQLVKQPTVLFDEGSMQRAWNRERFSGVTEE